MRSYFFIILFALLLHLPGMAAEPRQILVSPQWLQEHQQEKDIVVIHVSQNKLSYDKGHIPGARFLWIGWFALANPSLSFELVPLPQLDSIVEMLGITNQSRIVLCGVNSNVSQVARAYITFDYLGMGERTYILDGGVEEWKKNKQPIDTIMPVVKRSSFIPMIHRNAFVNADFVSKHLKNPNTAIVDARAPEYYRGDDANGYPRRGHIPGAKNLFFATLFDNDGKYEPLDTLKAMFHRAGVKDEHDLISYCHVGQTASPLYVIALMLGYTPHLYDGSFEDWSNREELPLVQEAKKEGK